MIAPYFLPRRRVGALRPFKFAIHLRDFGWEPNIITIASDGTLTEREEQLLQGISVYELEPPFDRTGRSGSQLTQSGRNKYAPGFSLADWVDKHFPVDTWLPFFWFKFGEIKRIFSKVSPDALWSTGDPWSAHWVGKKLSHKAQNIFWMADFRDPWTLSDTDLKQRSAFASAIDAKIERSWIQQASMLSFTSKSTRKLYAQKYDDLELKTTTIYNAFDRDLFVEDSDPDLSMNTSQLNVVFFGRFRRLSPAKPVIDIIAKLKQINPSAAEKIVIHSFGPFSNSDRQYLHEKGVENCFESQQPVPAEQGLEVLQKADLLLLSTSPERKDIIPAKLWDYLAARRPILSIAPNPEIAEILEETGTGIQYNPGDTDRVAELLKDCISAKERGDELPVACSGNAQRIDQYSARVATEKLANILEQHTG